MVIEVKDAAEWSNAACKLELENRRLRDALMEIRFLVKLADNQPMIEKNVRRCADVIEKALRKEASDAP